MRSNNKLINVRYNDGKVKRMARPQAHALVDKGSAKFISNTLYKATRAGVTVKPDMEDVDVKKAIRAAKLKAEPKKVVKTEKEPQPQQRRRRRGERSNRDRT